MEVSVITLIGRQLSFDKPSNDPFFFATKPYKRSNNNRFYRMGEPINSIACQEMVMFCSNITGSCSEWEGTTAHQVEQLLNVLGLDNNDKESKAALWTVISSLQMTLIYDRVAGRNAEALQASRWVYGLWQMRLSQEQWKVELEHWFQTALTVMQMTPLRVVSIPGLDRTRVERLQPIYPELYADACSMVKFYSPSHATVSLLRVILILVFSTLLILVSHIDWICYKIGSARMRRLVSSWEENDARRLLLTVERQNLEINDDESIHNLERIGTHFGSSSKIEIATDDHGSQSHLLLPRSSSTTK